MRPPLAVWHVIGRLDSSYDPDCPKALGSVVQCGRCRGRGWHWLCDTDEPEWDTTDPCTICAGEGQIALPPTAAELARLSSSGWLPVPLWFYDGP